MMGGGGGGDDCGSWVDAVVGFLYRNKGDTVSKESTCVNKFVKITTYLLFLSENKSIIDFFTSVNTIIIIIVL